MLMIVLIYQKQPKLQLEIKCDLDNLKREVNEVSKEIFETNYNIKIYEASAKENINVNECFNALVDKMFELGLGKKKYYYEEDDNDNLKKLEVKERIIISKLCLVG